MRQNHSQNQSGKLTGPTWGLVVIVAVVAYFVLSPKMSIEKNGDSASATILVENARAQDILSRVKSSSSQLKLVNMWATWCAPCVAEFPYLMKLHKNYESKGLELIFVSMDMQEELGRVKKFLSGQGVDFVTYIKNQSDNEFIQQMSPDWSGALPTSFFYNTKGELVHFWPGDGTYEEFEKVVLKHLSPQIK
jgi:thiol-disulfide isomerase/thioredoxin